MGRKLHDYKEFTANVSDSVNRLSTLNEDVITIDPVMAEG